jgi:hypothetical protein
MQPAAEELLGLGVTGLQLTPGNVPTEGFQEFLEENKVSVRSHHSFHWHRMKCRVWDDDATCLVNSHSVHPPFENDPCAEIWREKAERGEYNHFLLETMYPQYCLGSGEELEWAMALGLRLAVDVSHIYIQLCQGSLDEKVWGQLQAYENIGEIHLSTNNGKADIHQPLSKTSFGLEWTRDRAYDGIPVILECYLHRLSQQERKTQIEIVRDLMPL